MEGKTRASVRAACGVLIVVLLSGQQQQASAMSEFCRCYTLCYPNCRQHHGSPFTCKLLCWTSCIGATAAAAGGCKKICLESICDTAAAATGRPDAIAAGPADADAAACVDECTYYWSRYSNHT